MGLKEWGTPCRCVQFQSANCSKLCLSEPIVGNGRLSEVIGPIQLGHDKWVKRHSAAPEFTHRSSHLRCSLQCFCTTRLHTKHRRHGLIITKAGDNGVSFFFILSGFVLAWSSRDDDTTRRFYRRRAARILPLYWLAWLPGALYALVVDEAHIGNLLPSLFLVQGWFPQKDIHFAANSVGWSLSTELFFYLMFPFFFTLIRQFQAPALTAILVNVIATVIIIPLMLQPTEPAGAGYRAIYLLPVTRFFEFAAAGIALALLLRRGVRVPLPVTLTGLFAFAVSVMANWLPMYLLLVAATVIPFLLLIASAADADMRYKRSLLAWKPIVKLGEWSFAFYLVHPHSAPRGDCRERAHGGVTVVGDVADWLRLGDDCRLHSLARYWGLPSSASLTNSAGGGHGRCPKGRVPGAVAWLFYF